MIAKAKKVRSGPVYVETERGTVSLVFEGDLSGDGDAPHLVGKPDVYVIDGEGVRLVRRTNRIARALVVALVAYFLLRAVSMLLRGRNTH